MLKICAHFCTLRALQCARARPNRLCWPAFAGTLVAMSTSDPSCLSCAGPRDIGGEYRVRFRTNARRCPSCVLECSRLKAVNPGRPRRNRHASFRAGHAQRTLFGVNPGHGRLTARSFGRNRRPNDFPRRPGPPSSRSKIAAAHGPPLALRSPQVMRRYRPRPWGHRQGAIGASLQTERK